MTPEALAARGHRVVRGVCGLMLAMAVSVVLLYITTRGFDRIGAQVLRLFFTGLLAFALNRGYGWARWLTATLMCVAGAMGMTSSNALGIGLAVTHLSLAASLTFPRSVAAFFASRRPPEE